MNYPHLDPIVQLPHFGGDLRFFSTRYELLIFCKLYTHTQSLSFIGELPYGQGLLPFIDYFLFISNAMHHRNIIIIIYCFFCSPLLYEQSMIFRYAYY